GCGPGGQRGGTARWRASRCSGRQLVSRWCGADGAMTCASCLLLSEVGELLSFADDGGAHVPLAVANRTAVIPQSPGLEHRLRPEVGDRCGKTVEMRDGDADA